MPESNYVSFGYELIDSVSAYALSGFSDEGETVYRPVSSEDGLRVLVEKACSLNADGIINLKFEYFPGEIRTNDGKMLVKEGQR